MLMRTTLSAPAGNGLASLHGPGGLGATPCPNIVPRYPNLTSPWTLMARSHMIAKRKMRGSGARSHAEEIALDVWDNAAL